MLLQPLPGTCPVVGGRCWTWTQTLLNFCVMLATDLCKRKAAMLCHLCCEDKGVIQNLVEQYLCPSCIDAKGSEPEMVSDKRVVLSVRCTL